MDQIKQLRYTSQRIYQPEQKYQFQEIAITNPKKKKQQLEFLQPWLEESDRNPFISFKSQRIKKTLSPPTKRQVSFSLTKNWVSQQKIVRPRQSKILPIMDVGQLNRIKKSISPNKTRSKLDLISPIKQYQKVNNTQVALPSVTRQLSIQRKIFLMKHISTQQTYPSPKKSHRIRNIINKLGN